jgi:hypothetical protein
MQQQRNFGSGVFYAFRVASDSQYAVKEKQISSSHNFLSFLCGLHQQGIQRRMAE